MKKYLFLIIAICISQIMALNVSAYVGNFIASGIGTATDRNGNVYVTGQMGGPAITFGTITLTNPTANQNYMYIVKYDAGGSVLWAKNAGGPLNACGVSIATDSSGNVFVAGWFTSYSITFGNTTLINNGYSATNPSQPTIGDIFIVKYDPYGNVLWAKSAGGILDDEPKSIVTDASGNVYLTGYFNSPSIIFGGTSFTNTGTAGPDIFIVKYDPNGNVIWAETAGGSGNDEGLGIARDNSGNVYVTGYFSSSHITFGETTLNNAGGNDLFIAKYDTNGNPIWAVSAGGSATDWALGVATDGSGNVYVTGGFMSPTITFGTFTLINAGSGYLDMFIVKYDPSGNVLWAKRAGGSIADEGMSIATDGSGNAFVTGIFLSSSITFGNTTPLINNGGGDEFIVKYNATDGSALWAKNAGGSSRDLGNSVTTDANGNVFVAGQFMSTSITFGTITLKNPKGNTTNGYDMFIAKYTSNGNVPWAKTAVLSTSKPKSTNAGINDPTSNEITVYPNPTSGKVLLSTGSSVSAITSISVFNITGKEVFSRQSAACLPDRQVGNSEITIDLSNQPKGIFILLIKSGDSYYRRKIIVE